MAKKFFFLIFSLLIATQLAAAAPAASTAKQEAALKSQIKKIETDLKRQQALLARTKNQRQRNRIIDMIDGHYARIAVLKKQLEALSPTSTPAPLVTQLQPPALSMTVQETLVTYEVADADQEELEVVEEVVPVITRKRFNFEAGLGLGMYASAGALLAELRLPTGFVWGPARGTVRLGTALAQTNEGAKRYIPFSVDFILNYPAGSFAGTPTYLGGGVNYLVSVAGEAKTSGTYGAQLFYGVESEGFGGMVFGEVGFGALRTGYSPSQKGVIATAGYRFLAGF